MSPETFFSMEVDTFFRFKTFLHQRGGLSEFTWHLLEEVIEMHDVKKGELTLVEGNVCAFIDFIDEGSFRMYNSKDGKDITTGLYLRGGCITDMKSLSLQAPSHVNIVANERSVVIRLRRKDLIDRYSESSELQALGRALLESMIVQESGWKEMFTLYDPAERYAFLMEKTPELVSRFPLQHIASFLGVRRETLSRIRARYV